MDFSGERYLLAQVYPERSRILDRGSVIIPAYNKTKNIKHLIEYLCESYLRYDCVVVSNSFKDNMAAI